MSDLVIAESGTRFGFTETRLGILPAVISPFVIAKIGESNARALFPGGRRFDATRAARIGLVHEIVEGEDALDTAVESAVADLLAAGPTAARAAKAVVREVRGLGHGSTKWHTARLIARQRVSAEAQEGFAAFTEKRKPSWIATGRVSEPVAEGVVGEVPCYGCGALVPDVTWPSHRYVGASPGCWAIYAEVAGGGLLPPLPSPYGALVVDAYMAQHPGVPGPQSTQSVWVHLIALQLVLEGGWPDESARSDPEGGG